MIELGNEAQSVLDLAGDDPGEAMRWCLMLLAGKEMEVTELRAVRREIIARLRADGMTLEAIARTVGRTKQTVAQW